MEIMDTYKPKRWAFGIFIACLGLLLGLSGCANKFDSIAGRSELVTESDETGERKRARIRLELAVGYFEQ